MLRHLLMLGLFAVGIAAVGANLNKRQLPVEFHGELQSAIRSTKSLSERLDSEFEASWRELDLPSAPLANNLLVVRRLGLALTGTVPSLEELRALESIAEDRQIDWWLQHLFQDQRHADYLAERFTRAFVGTEDGPFLIFRRRRFVAWLSDQLMENRPYDEIVRSLISDDGAWTDKPAVNFITVTTASTEDENPDAERLAARTARAFLGVRLDCMQCHDDNMGGDWLQSDFHQLAAYYSEARSFGLGLGIKDVAREYEFKYLDAEEEVVVPPSVPFHGELQVERKGHTEVSADESLGDDDGSKQDAKPAKKKTGKKNPGKKEGDKNPDGKKGDSKKPARRRQELAAWVTHPENRAFARATVNRVWAFMFGVPLVDPVDDIPLEGPYPPGFELLTDDFAEHHDVRRLIVAIANSRVFRQQSRLPEIEATAEMEKHWSVFPLIRLRPEQVAHSVVQAASLSTIDSNSNLLQLAMKFGQSSDFVKRYGDRGEDEFLDQGGTIPQRLVMLNGELVWERTKDDLIVNAATRVAQQVKDDARAIELAYLIVLTRKPSPKELEHFTELVQDTSMNRNQRFEDLFWTLLNSTEFSWNH